MRKSLKKIMTFALSAAMLVTGVSSAGTADAATKTNEGGAVTAASTNEVETPDNPSAYTDMSATEIIADMGTGWNLGNTMDGHNDNTPGETAWQGAKTTKSFIKYVHDAGFNTIRIPVTWGNMINADYSINEGWMSRVQDIVDYAAAENMYIILNIHHDGADNASSSSAGYGEDGYNHGWLDITPDDETAWNGVKTKFAGVWKTIAERFKNYDEHLILESMNEVYIHGQGWTQDAESISKQNKRINELNQIFVDTVRATGSNNAKRWLTLCAVNTNIKFAVGNYDTSFELPKDSVSGRLMVTVHDYDGYSRDSVDESKANSYADQFKKLKNKFVDNGVPVLIDEYGFQAKFIADVRACKYEGVNYLAKKYGMVPVAWDNNGAGSGESFRLLNRYFNKPYSVKSVSAIMRGYFVDTQVPVYRFSASDGELAITKMTAINADTENVSLKVGEKKNISVTTEPAGNNDVVLWKSDDSGIAAVYNGQITAKGVGQTTVYAYSQADAYDNSMADKVEKAIKVTVTKADIKNQTAAIQTDFDTYKLEDNQEAFLNAYAKAADGSKNGAALSFSSSDEKVATVSSNGKIVATGSGNAVITITSADGIVKTVDVSVNITNPSEEIKPDSKLDENDDAPSTNDNTNNGGNSDNEVSSFKSGNVTYKVVKAGSTVSYESNTKKASIKTVNIPSTVKYAGKTYKVVKIADSAFKNSKKLTSVTIGANIKEIGKDAFNGCSKLNSIKVTSKAVTKVGANAFKNTTSKLVIKVPSSKLSSYKKIFNAKGQSKKAVIKK